MSRYTFLFISFVLWLACSAPLIAQQPSQYFTERGKVSFVSDAPLERIAAASDQLKAAVDIEKQTFLFVLDNASFKGFNSPLQQEHFHENYMESRTYPQTSFKGKIIETLLPAVATTQVVRAKGLLNVHGVTVERIIKARIEYRENQIHITSEFDILLEDHHIRVPKVVARKIASEVQVAVDAILQKNQN